MTGWQLRTPVAFLIFNRPETTRRVFEAIRYARPPRLLVVADGPRPNVPGDAERCSAARAVIDSVDWECQVVTNYAEANMGCKRRVSSGLTWVFDTVEEAIILEDDCLPHPTFFRFCEELLERYRSDERVMAISGDNFGVRPRTDASYYFSLFNFIWGWASWRRAWQLYDLEMSLWPTVRDGGWLLDVLQHSDAARYWAERFQLCHDGRLDTWDYPWTFACWINGGLTAVSTVNLVSNIGFGSDGTHTMSMDESLANIPAEGLTFPLRHPQLILRDTRADAFVQETRYNPGWRRRVERKLHHLFGKLSIT